MKKVPESINCLFEWDAVSKEWRFYDSIVSYDEDREDQKSIEWSTVSDAFYATNIPGRLVLEWSIRGVRVVRFGIPEKCHWLMPGFGERMSIEEFKKTIKDGYSAYLRTCKEAKRILEELMNE